MARSRSLRRAARVRSYRRHLLRIQRTTHLPPGTSKWNKIEHRLFSQITLNWLLLARFWAGVLGWELAEDRRGGIALLPSDDIGFRIRVLQTLELKSGQNQLLFDLTSTSLEDQQQTVARLLGLGARHIDIGQRPEEGHVVLADPEGNEFCVIEPGNNFLADCGFIGAVACDAWVERNSLPLFADNPHYVTTTDDALLEYNRAASTAGPRFFSIRPPPERRVVRCHSLCISERVHVASGDARR